MLCLYLTTAVVFLVAAVSGEEEELYRPTRIVNGQPVPPGKAQWQVSIQTKWGGLHYCGGTLISPQWVLTACHCTIDKSAADMRVGIGSNVLSHMRQFYNVKKIMRHEFYSKKTLMNDIALLELDNKSDKIARGVNAEVISRETNQQLVSSNCYVTGFGRLSVGGPKATTMLQAQVPLYTYAQCRASFASSYYITEGHVCAGGKNKDACQGDSGGPLVCCKGDLGTATDCKLVGVTSWGIGCANEGIPGVYTKVSHYKDWIDATMAGRKYEEKQFQDKGGWNFFQQLHNFISAVLPFSDEKAWAEGQKIKEKELKKAQNQTTN